MPGYLFPKNFDLNLSNLEFEIFLKTIFTLLLFLFKFNKKFELKHYFRLYSLWYL